MNRMAREKTKKSHERARKVLLLLDQRREKGFIVKKIYAKPADTKRKVHAKYNNLDRDLTLIDCIVSQTNISPLFKGKGKRIAKLREKFRKEERKYREFLRKSDESSKHPDDEQLRKSVADMFKNLKITEKAKTYGEKSVFRKGQKAYILIDPAKLPSLWAREQKNMIQGLLDSPKGKHLHFLSSEEDRKHDLIDSLAKNRFMFKHLKLFLLECIKSGHQVNKITEILGGDYAYALVQKRGKIIKILSERASMGREYKEFAERLSEYANFLPVLKLEPESMYAMDYSLDSVPSLSDEWEIFYSNKK